MLSTSSIPSQLAAPQSSRLVQLLSMHYSYPLPYPLSGSYFEELFATAIHGRREKRKLLFDVCQGSIGWSLKTLLWSNLEPETSFEVVIQRCDILKDKALSIQSDVVTLGRRILQHFNRFGEESLHKQDIDDARCGFLLRNRAERDFVFFQQRYQFYSDGGVIWRWANSDQRSLLGFRDGKLVLRWYRSGTQLFGVYSIPGDANTFRLDWQRVDLDATLAFFLGGHR